MTKAFSIDARSSILIVGDQASNHNVLIEFLQQKGFRVSLMTRADRALMTAEEASPDLILLEVMMPELSGYDICKQLIANSATQDIPIIFLGAVEHSLDMVKAFSLGCADYIKQPIQPEEVLVRVQHQLKLRLAQFEIIKLNDHLEQRIHERTAELMALNQSLAEEIAERKHAEEQMRYGALHDALTSLPNRILFTEHLELARARAQRNQEYQFAVLFIDLDRFKSINDTMGHQAGDELLVMVAKRLHGMLRATDILSRLGGDEFIILLDKISDLEEAVKISERIVTAFKQPFSLKNSSVFATVSVGVALNSPLAESSVDLLRNADIAMYQAKGSGKARLKVFDQQMYIQTLQKHELEKDLRQALGRNEFELHYQPIFDIHAESIMGFEALLRWHHPRRGWITPAEFIPMAEELGVIVTIGEWVLQTACEQLAQWQSEFPDVSSLYVSVNLSMMQLRESHFSETLDSILLETGLGKRCLQLELTESMLMGDSIALVALLNGWVKQGIRLSIDDFGTGYSNLGYLHQFPIQSIKVDQSFVRSMLETTEKYKIVETIINLAHQLGMTAIAEGIEHPEHLKTLKALDCDKGQGYFFSAPLPKDAAKELLMRCLTPREIDYPMTS